MTTPERIGAEPIAGGVAIEVINHYDDEVENVFSVRSAGS